MSVVRIVLLWLLCATTPLAWAQEQQESGAEGQRGGLTLSFTFYYGELKAADVTDTLLFSEDGSAYTLESNAAAVGLARVLYGDSASQSRGVVDDVHGLRMTLYQQQRGKRAPQQAERLGGGTLRLQRGKGDGAETREEVLEAGEAAMLFDHLSAVYRGYILGRVTAGKFHSTNGWRLREYEYVDAGTETVQTGMGEMEAVLLLRESERGARKIWLAPGLDYLPVRLYVDDKGHEFTTVLEAVQR